MKTKTNSEATVKVTFADGTPDAITTRRAALDRVAQRYGVAVETLVTEDNDGARPRTLVWIDEESAKNDDGSKAVAEITVC